MTETYRVKGDDGLLSVIPLILGFHPTDSLVLACLRGDRQKLEPIARIDLTDYWNDAEDLAERLAFMALQHADRAILVFYGLEVDPLGFDELLREQGLPVVDTVFTSNTPHRLHPELNAENVVRGRVVEDGRQALRTRVEFNPRAETAPDRTILHAMADAGSRDEYLAANMGRAAEVLPAILTVCRQIPDDGKGAANLCATAALLAYRVGDGALSQVCLDRVLRIEQNHFMAQLMIWAMALAIKPEDLDVLVQDPPVKQEHR